MRKSITETVKPSRATYEALEEMVRKCVSRTDRVIMVEPMRLAVVAVADQQGAEAMRQRLEDVCDRWCGTMLGSQGPARPAVVATTTSADGARASVLLQHAKAQLTQAIEHRRAAGDAQP